MRFSDKLFFTVTAFMTITFTVFGIWLLSSFFQKILAREMEQGNMENQMFQYVFEMAYSAVPQEHRNEYTLNQLAESVISSLEGEGKNMYIFDEAQALLYGKPGIENHPSLLLKFKEIQDRLGGFQTFGYQIYLYESRYYLLSSCISSFDDSNFYLAVQKDITSIYNDRVLLLGQYMTSMLLLLGIGAVFVFILSRFITKPIRLLSETAQTIASGDYRLRSSLRSRDEIGELAASFNLMADELVKRMEEKEQEARIQEDFTAAFAHELKTPLTSIIGYAEMLCTMHLSDEEINEASRYIRSQGKRLESLSYKLLTLVSVDKQEYPFHSIKTESIQDTLLAAWKPVSMEKHIFTSVKLETGTIYGDMDLLLSLLFNLFDNSIKALNHGGSVILEGKNTVQGYEFTITDNGRGIPAEEIPHITEAFYMVDKSRARKEGGAGLGMALCKKIIDIHQGSWQINSIPGSGTTIRIWLPKYKERTDFCEETEIDYE